MGRGTAIAWCDDTVNLWWGCTHHGPGCANCYAEAWARRCGQDVWGPTAPRRFFPDDHHGELDRLNRLAAAGDPKLGLPPGHSRRVFVGSMMDVCEDRPDLQARARRFLASAHRWPWLDLLLLTKRPERYPTILPTDWRDGYPNVWLCASAVTQAEVERNAAALFRVPAVVRGLSLEPLLERVTTRSLAKIQWRIVGGESGGLAHARHFDPEWCTDVIDDAYADGAAVFVKQYGSRWAAAAGGLSRKADQPDQWQPLHRVQQHPQPRRTSPAVFAPVA